MVIHETTVLHTVVKVSELTLVLKLRLHYHKEQLLTNGQRDIGKNAIWAWYFTYSVRL